EQVAGGHQFSPDGARLAAVVVPTRDNEPRLQMFVKMWDVASGREVCTLRGAGLPISFTFSPDGRRLASTDSDRTLRILATGRCEELLVVKAGPNQTLVLFSPAGRLLVSAGPDGAVRGWYATPLP